MRKDHPSGLCEDPRCVYCAINRALGTQPVDPTNPENLGAAVTGERLREILRDLAVITAEAMCAVPRDHEDTLMKYFFAVMGAAMRRAREKNEADPLWRATVEGEGVGHA